MIRPGLHQGIPQPFLTQQQHGPSTPSQPHNLNLLPGANQNMNFLQNPHSSNGPFNPQLARIQSDSRRRDIHTQSQRATAGGAQTPSAVNGVLPAQPPGVGYSGMNGQVPAHRVVSQPGGPLPPSHPGSMSNPGLGLTGGLQTPRSVSQPQPQQQMGMRPGQPSLQGQPVGQIRQPPVGMPGIPSGTGMRGSGGMGVMAPGMIGNISQQTPPQQGFPSALGIGGPGSQPPPQGSQGPASSMSQPMHRTISTPEGNSFGGMPGFGGGPFSQAGPHPPTGHTAGPNSANHFSFMPSSSSPSQPIDMHGLSSGGAGPSSTSPTRSDFTVTPAQQASLQYGHGALSGSSGSGSNDTFHPTSFTTMPPQPPPQRPSSSSHSTLGLAPQQASTAQGLSHPTPPRQQTPLQQPQMSQAHLPERLSAPISNPTRPQSQPQRPSSQQQAGRSPTPRMTPGTLPANAMLLQGHPTSITGAPAPPPQHRPSVGPVAGPPPLTSASSTENGDLSRQPGVPIRPSMPRFGLNL